jgi:hypothetical protein
LKSRNLHPLEMTMLIKKQYIGLILQLRQINKSPKQGIKKSEKVQAQRFVPYVVFNPNPKTPYTYLLLSIHHTLL